jgi:hypothetical protein
LRDAGYVIEEPDSEDDLGGVVDEKAAYVQVEEVVEKIISRDDFRDEKTLSSDHHHRPRQHLAQERGEEEEEESEGVGYGSSLDEVMGRGQLEERSVLGLILDDDTGGERNRNGEDEEFGEFLSS